MTYTYSYDSDGNVTAVSGNDGFGIVYTNEESTTSGTTTVTNQAGSSSFSNMLSKYDGEFVCAYKLK